jgi:TRAP-type C4-dicarboxylate transport system permease small subunit
MPIWITEILKTWLHVALLFGATFVALAALLIAREWITAARDRRDAERRLSERIRKYTHG